MVSIVVGNFGATLGTFWHINILIYLRKNKENEDTPPELFRVVYPLNDCSYKVLAIFWPGNSSLFGWAIFTKCVKLQK